MEAPPDRLDGAVVLHYVRLATLCRVTGAVKHFVGDREVQPARALAICQYPGEAQAYLFHCGADWEVLTDDLCDSVSDAFREAQRQFDGLAESEWMTVAAVAHELEVATAEETAARAALPDDYVAEDTLSQLVSEGRDLEAMKRLLHVRNLSLYEAYQYVRRLKKQSGE